MLEVLLLLLQPTLQGCFRAIRGFECVEAGLGLKKGYEGFTMMLPDRLGMAGLAGNSPESWPPKHARQ